MNRLLFVYGTLQGRSRHPVAERLREMSRLVGAARTQGRLYDLGAYPALVASPHGEDVVRGELIELASPADSLPWLDAYEGPEYERRLVMVRLADESSVEAWCYVYTTAMTGYPRIVSGVWDE